MIEVNTDIINGLCNRYALVIISYPKQLFKNNDDPIETETMAYRPNVRLHIQD